MADDDQKLKELKAARERMSRLREEAKDVEIGRIQHEIKVLQKQRNELRLARFRKRGCQEESLARSLFEPLVAERVAEPFTPRKQGAKHERSPNFPSGNGREKSGKPLEPQAPPTSKPLESQSSPTSKRLSPRAILTESPLRSILKQSPPRSPPERPKFRPPRLDVHRSAAARGPGSEPALWFKQVSPRPPSTHAAAHRLLTSLIFAVSLTDDRPRVAR